MPGSLYILMKREGTISILGQGRAGALRAASSGYLESVWGQDRQLTRAGRGSADHEQDFLPSFSLSCCKYRQPYKTFLLSF